MKIRALFAVLALLAFAGPAHAGAAEAPWSGTYVDSTSSGVVTYRIWIDEGPVQNGKMATWAETQAGLRFSCMNCDPKAWDGLHPGAGMEFFWKVTNKSTRDQQYHPLPEFSFMIVSISVSGPVTSGNRRAWRMQPDDGVTVTLTDGRRFSSVSTVVIRSLRLSLGDPTGSKAEFCNQMRAMLSARSLFTGDEIRSKWNSPEYVNQAENLFLILIRNGGYDFKLKEIAGITLRIFGKDVVLNPRTSPMVRAGS
ncbi:MAG: hypothetical protein HY567_01525 [Candidatus Kerfeldbacteria bacterium]|nr:hypothetical protein [Candidatus Kerfeldbacteria bacterium]